MLKSGLKNKTVSLITVLFLGMFTVSLNAFSQTRDELNYPTLISVQYKKGAVLINFEPVVRETIQYRIYRSKSPIKSQKDLQNAISLSEIAGDKVPYKDAPDEDGKYYYAVTVIKEGNEYIELVPFQNITLRPVDYSPIPEPVQSITVTLLENHLLGISFTPIREDYTYKLYVSSQRIVYTPRTDQFSVLSKKDDHFQVEIQEEKPYYFFISTSNRLGVENKTIIPENNATSLAFIKKKPEIKPTVIKKKPVVVSASKLLEDNLRNNFYNGNYSAALKVFQRILIKHKLSASQRGMTYFYMGQCYYYQGNYKSAVRYFILSKEIRPYKNKAELWIDRCLEMVD